MTHEIPAVEYDTPHYTVTVRDVSYAVELHGDTPRFVLMYVMRQDFPTDWEHSREYYFGVFCERPRSTAENVYRMTTVTAVDNVTGEILARARYESEPRENVVSRVRMLHDTPEVAE